MCSKISHGAGSQISKRKYFTIFYLFIYFLVEEKGYIAIISISYCLFFGPVLQDAREDLRCSMAKDVVSIRNETLNFTGDKNCMEILSGGIKGTMLKDMSSDFQKKVTFTKHDKGNNEVGFLYGNGETYKKMAGMFEFVLQPIEE